MDREQARAWMDQWRAAGPALARQRALELRQLDGAQALEASERLLSLSDPRSVGRRRLESSGLVDQQRAFRQARA